MGAEKCIKNLVRKPERKRSVGRTILTCSFTECGVRLWNGLNRFRMQSSGTLL
jgi:hypothetical protein